MSPLISHHHYDTAVIVTVCVCLVLALLCESAGKLAKYQERKRRRVMGVSRGNVIDLRDQTSAGRWWRMIGRG
jgi:hypothetical protein